MKLYTIIDTAHSDWKMPERPPQRSHNRQVHLYVQAKSKAAAVRAFNATGAHITMHYFNGYGSETGSPRVQEILAEHPEGTVFASWLDDYSREGLVKVSKD